MILDVVINLRLSHKHGRETLRGHFFDTWS